MRVGNARKVTRGLATRPRTGEIPRSLSVELGERCVAVRFKHAFVSPVALPAD